MTKDTPPTSEEVKPKKTRKQSLLEQRAKLDAQLQEITNKESDATRKANTRRKIILGGAFIALSDKGLEITKKSVLDYIRNYEKARPSDLVLMDYFLPKVEA